MSKASMETAVGIFVLIGIACLGYLSIKLGKLELVGGNHYPVVADFGSVSGLKNGASVEIAGVVVGRVSRITLDPRDTSQAQVEIQISNGVPVTEDVIASIRTRGIIGDKYIKLQPGGAEKNLAAGGRIRNTEAAIDIEEMISQYIQGKI